MFWRRVLAVVAGASVLGAVWAAPVAAADWSRGVTFPAAGFDGETTILDWNALDTPACGASSAWLAYEFVKPEGGVIDAPSGTDRYDGSGFSLCRTYGYELWWTPLIGITAGGVYDLQVDFAGDHDGQVRLYWLLGTYGSTVYNGPEIGTYTTTTGTDCDGSWACYLLVDSENPVGVVAPSGAVGIGWAFGVAGHAETSVSVMWVSARGPASGGNCVGTGALASDQSGVTGTWGDQWVDTYTACVASTTHVVRYVPGDWGAGHLVQLAATFAAESPHGSPGRVRMEWLFAAGVGVTAYDQSTLASNDGYPRIKNIETVAPNLSIGMRFTIYGGTALVSLGVDDVNIGGYNGGGTSDANDVVCLTPEDNLDLGGWVGWLGCVVDQGLQEVSARITTGFERLMMPTQIGAEWTSFVDTLNGKVPFGWIAEAVGVVEGFVSVDVAGSAPPASFVLMGATVPIDLTVTEPIEVYRPALATVVWVGLAMGIIRLGRGVFGGSSGGGEA